MPGRPGEPSWVERRGQERAEGGVFSIYKGSVDRHEAAESEEKDGGGDA